MSQEDAAPEGKKPEVTDNNVTKPEGAEKPQDGPQTFDADYVKQLRSEAAANRKRAQEAEAKIAEREEAEKTELEKLSGKLSKLEQEKVEATTALLRFQVAAEKQIPTEAVELLTGNTREELEAKADKLLDLVKSRTETNETPDFDGGAREPAPESQTPEEEHNKNVLALLGLTPH